ncbi:BRO-N domain-containing protein [Candidatus Rhodobacter oscarellae]|uniref:BRO-N domain-containing protein n=1 Tax=Candidatus Rhodobacter oscarellae TaxID=1675527 RepID=UPI0022856DEA|nr:BRO family protein [Candidatus Rhodobacter lobularis]
MIDESGLNKLAMRSDKPQAHAFQDWVTREVIPSIRKTDGYSVAAARNELRLRQYRLRGFRQRAWAQDEKRTENRSSPNLNQGWPAHSWLCAPSSLNRLSKPEYLAFRHRATGVALPALCKNGSYSMARRR